MSTIYDYLPYIIMLAALVLILRFISGMGQTEANDRRQQIKRDYYRWDDKSAHRD